MYIFNIPSYGTTIVFFHVAETVLKKDSNVAVALHTALLFKNCVGIVMSVGDNSILYLGLPFA